MVGNGVLVGVRVGVEVGSGVFTGVIVAVSACAAAVNACAIAVLMSGLYWLSSVGGVASTCPQAERRSASRRRDKIRFLLFGGILVGYFTRNYFGIAIFARFSHGFNLKITALDRRY